MKKKELIIFLDIDGVLNNNGDITKMGLKAYNELRDDFKRRYNCIFPLPDMNLIPFVRTINAIKKTCNVKCILSSTWRLKESNIALLNRIFTDYGCVDNNLIIGRTNGTPGNMRGRDIEAYVDNNNVKNYIIIDDDSDMLPNQMSRFYKTNIAHGFSEKDEHRFYYYALDSLKK